MRTFVVCAVLTVAVLEARGDAQTVALTESEVLAQLGTGSPRIRAARAGVDVARADVLAAARWPNPRVTFNREAVAGVAEDMLVVSQVLPLTGRRRLEISAATSSVEASAQRAEDRVRRVRADARLAFTDLWSAQEQERELSRTRDRLDELAALLARREAAGDASGLDRLRADGEVLDVDVARATAASARAQAQAILSGFLPPGGAAALAAVRPSVAGRDLPGIDDLMARAEATRGDLIALARDIDAAAYSEQAARRRAIPEPEVVAGTKTSNAAGGDVGSIVSVHVSVPLFDRGRPERALAQARDRQARAEADVLRQSIRAHIAAWRAAVVERRAMAERHGAALAVADQIERIAQVSYEGGERGLLDLLDAYRTASGARLRQMQLEAAAREAEIELEFVSGWEIP